MGNIFKTMLGGETTMWLMEISGGGLGYIVIGGVVIIMAILVPFLIRRNKHTAQSSFVPVREQWKAREEGAKVKNSADRILVELVETSREISARMDTKIRILNTLVKDAERAIVRLEELHNIPHVPSQPINDEIKEEEKMVDSTINNNVDDSQLLREKLLTKNNNTPTTTGLIDNLPTMPSGPPINIGDDIPDIKNKDEGDIDDAANYLNNRVISLLSQGLEVAEVARQTGISRQEVNIIKHLQSK